MTNTARNESCESLHTFGLFREVAAIERSVVEDLIDLVKAYLK